MATSPSNTGLGNVEFLATRRTPNTVAQ